MEKRIELEKRGRKPAQIKELNLDNCRSTHIVGITEDFLNLRVLSLINVGLTTLKGFPKLPKLRKLELSDNRINGGLNFLNGSPKLACLNLSGNKIKTIDALEPLKEFKNLKNLDLFNCEVTHTPEYKEKVFDLLPSLKFLDGYDREEKEAEDSDDDVNGNDEEDSAGDSDDEDIEDAEEEEEDEDEEEGDDEVGLSAIYKDLDEESEGEDYEAEEGDEADDFESDGIEEEDEKEEDDTEETSQRGTKRKLDEA